jgi:hypothetical protein
VFEVPVTEDFVFVELDEDDEEGDTSDEVVVDIRLNRARRRNSASALHR